MVLLLLGMTIADGLITLDLIENECEEVNPVMRWLLDQGHVPFLAGKYVLTASGLPFLVAFENRPLFRTRFRTGYVLPIFVTLYMLLLYYQVGMLREREYLRGLQALATAPPNPSVGPPTRTE